MEHFSPPIHTETSTTPQVGTCYAAIHSFWSNDNKQDTITTVEHNNHIIKLLKQCSIMYSMKCTIWKNKDTCADQYRCATTLYLMEMLSQEFSVIIECGISVPGHVR